MNLEELQARRKKLSENSETISRNMDKIANESLRVAEVAHNTPQILDDLDREFESVTGLDKKDIEFLFAATGLQLMRIFVANLLTEIEEANKGKREKWLHDVEDEILGNINPDGSVVDKPYYASTEHIISKKTVPYDATTSLTGDILNKAKKPLNWSFDISDFILDKKIDNFKGANHRFATLGHDPIIGLVVGTANIMTNTITFVGNNETLSILDMDILQTKHVIYTDNYSHPMIGTPASTAYMMKKTLDRSLEEPEALVASIIKQVIHIGTDMYTPCGIQIPGANLVMSNSKVEELTEKIGWGDIAKVGTSALVADLINNIISVLHKLTHDMRDGVSEELYEVKTRKILLYSNTIATGSNVLYTGIKTGVTGDISQLRKLDWGGLIILLKRLREDTKFIREIKEEFITSGFNKLIQGEDLQLEEIKP
ncbi:MAG: hypothetical protein IKY94_05440 [Lachnospiraceae bacterium]|nr:hypothetical protein [Lachnospiraceae bacterium]